MGNKLIKAVEDLINKAKGYESSNPGKASGKEAEAVDHSVPTDAPSEDENEKETNKANSGTHPEAGGKGRKSVSGSRPEGGEDFPDGGAMEDEIKGSSGPSGRAPQGHPGSLKHEGGGTGPNHPGTATSTEGQQKSKSADLNKAEMEVKTDSDEEDKDKGEEEDSEKSKESGEVFLDIDEFASEIEKSVTEKILTAIREEFGPALNKSEESEYIEAGLAKSVAATLDRVEEIEKAIVNISKVMNVRKSLINKSELGGGVKRSALEGGTSLSKSEIAGKLVDLQFKGDQEVNTPFVVRFESMPIEEGIKMLTPSLKSKLGIE